MSGVSVVIGSGANELVAAHYLARAGHEVLVLAQNTPPEDAMLDSGWIPPGIIRDLDLQTKSDTAAALSVYSADPWMVGMLPDGERLELWNDPARCAESIRRFSPRDAERWPAFCTRMARLARVLGKLYGAPPPDLMTGNAAELARLVGLAFAIRRLGREGVEDLMRVLPMPVADLLDDWFECDALKGILGAAGVMHLRQGPRSGGTAFRLLHHHVGNTFGVFRPPISNLRRVLEVRRGISLRRDAIVVRIAVREERVASVVLADGEEIETPLVLCGADPGRTLLEWVDAGWPTPDFTRAVRHVRSQGVVARVTLTLERAAGFNTWCIAPSLNYLERGYDDVKYGRVSSEPYLEARARNSGSANGGPTVDVDMQYVPYALSDAPWDEAQRRALADRAMTLLGQAIPGFDREVKTSSVLVPPDLETRYGFPQGQPHHAELALDQALWMRPVPGWASYRTPIRGLYLCGPGTHPGGAIAGAAGANAARVVMGDLRQGKRR
jgi:phytoene dehydrogenase-like protein